MKNMSKLFGLVLSLLVLSSLFSAFFPENALAVPPKVTAGVYHNMALKSNGKLWAWGGNGSGQLGDKTTIDKIITDRVQITRTGNPTDTWTAVAAGGYHTIALDPEAKLWSWGYNGQGQLGRSTGTEVYSHTPVKIPGDDTWIAIAAGKYHTIAIKTGGTLWAWGYNGQGQLGDDTITDRTTPTLVAGGGTWTAIAAGGYHTIATKLGDTLWSWGYNGQGQLGRTIIVPPADTPGQVGNGTWTSIAAGEFHTIAIKTGNTLWAWGYNGQGQLGNGTYDNEDEPIQIGTDINWGSTAAGWEHSIALKDGRLYAWGYNYFGQLGGDGTTTNRTTPSQIGTDSDWVSMAAGFYHSIAIKSDPAETFPLQSWGGVDLTVSNLTVYPSNALPDALVTVTATIQNVGGVGAFESTIRFYFSTDSTYNAGDTQLGGVGGDRTVPSLAAGAISSIEMTVNIPSNLSAGTYYIIAVADADGVVTEFNKANNIKSRVIMIMPDLIVSALSAPSSAAADDHIIVTDTTRNSGGAEAAASTTRFYLSTNSIYDPATDYPLGSRSVSSLAAGATHSCDTTVQIPGWGPGKYYIIAVADASGAITEANEANNVRSSSITIGPDLIVSALSAPSSAAAGSPITVTDTTRNSGGATTTSTSTTKFYLSANSIYDPLDIPLLNGFRLVPTLLAGATSSGSISSVIPTPLPAGTYYIIAVADATVPGVVTEANEANNTKSKAIIITP